MSITNRSHGAVVETRHANGMVVHSEGVDRANHPVGYVQRPFRPGMVSRTSNDGRATVYREVRYGGTPYYQYVPPVYYHRDFYSWEARPWQQPVAYTWGWQSAPWARAYQGYFVPEPTYPDAAMWMTDYIIAANLQSAYNVAPIQPNGFQDSPPAPDPASAGQSFRISPEDKAQIADQIRSEIRREQLATITGTTTTGGSTPGDASVPPPALDPDVHMFIVSFSLDLPQGNQTCPLTPGDFILRTDTNVVDGKVGVMVQKSRPGDCPPRTVSQLDLKSLQEMYNHFAEHLSSAQQNVATNEANKIFPQGPQAGARTNPDGQAPPDQSVQQDLSQQQLQSRQVSGGAVQ